MPVKLVASLAALTWALLAAAEPSAGVPDPVLDALVKDALANSPEYAGSRAAAEAERQREPQAGSLPDPTLSLGIQNDGFNGIQVGKMETSYYQIMVTQPFPWPGKRGARASAARAKASVVEAQLDRIRLSVTAEVERAYVEPHWDKARGEAVVYENVTLFGLTLAEFIGAGDDPVQWQTEETRINAGNRENAPGAQRLQQCP